MTLARGVDSNRVPRGSPGGSKGVRPPGGGLGVSPDYKPYGRVGKGTHRFLLTKYYTKIASGRKADTVTLGRSTMLLTLRSTATLQMT